MGVDVVLQDEDGEVIERVGDPYGDVASWPCDNSSFPLLQYVDPYGDTVFNRGQMDQIIRELDALVANSKDVRHRDSAVKVRALAVRCRDHVHLYLKFIGD